MTVKHFGYDPFKVWHGFDDSVRPRRPSRVRSFVLGCGLAAGEEEVEALKAQLKAAGATFG